MMGPVEERSGEGAVAVGAVADGYRVERVLSVRTGRHTLAQATSPEGERVLLQLSERQPAEKGLRRRAARLASVRGSISHAHLLPLVGYGAESGDLHWGAVPADVATLAERLSESPLELKWVVGVLSQLSGALETARRQGLVPRSLTPADILVTDTEPPRALLADVGIDVPDVPACKHPFSVADADYLSPEEIRGAEPTPESCVYSLCCILVHCLTGAPPFPYDRPLLTLHAHQVEDPPSVSERNQHLPPELDLVVSRALSKEPRRRQRTPVAFMRAVQDALHVRAALPVRGHSSTRQQAPRAAPPLSTPSRARRERAAPHQAPAPVPVAPRAQAAPQKADAGAGRRPRRARPKRPRRPARRLRIPRAAITWSSLALAASGVAGFAAGAGGTESAAPAVNRQAMPAAAEPTRPAVSPVVKRLQAQRVALRQRLVAAKRPQDQLAAVKALQSAYGRAQDALRREPGVAHREASLLASFSEVEDAYRRLAVAGSEQSSAVWQAARARVAESERDLELLLRTGRWS
jgi:Protein kinase domain